MTPFWGVSDCWTRAAIGHPKNSRCSWRGPSRSIWFVSRCWAPRLFCSFGTPWNYYFGQTCSLSLCCPSVGWQVVSVYLLAISSILNLSMFTLVNFKSLFMVSSYSFNSAPAQHSSFVATADRQVQFATMSWLYLIRRPSRERPRFFIEVHFRLTK